MAGIEFRLNGRKMTSASQLERELKQSIEKQVHDSLKKASGPKSSVRRVSGGYVIEAPEDQILGLAKRLR